MDHRNQVDQNARLVDKAAEYNDYNQKLYSLIRAQEPQLARYELLKRENDRLLRRREIAGLVDHKEEVRNLGVTDAKETGSFIRNELLYGTKLGVRNSYNDARLN